MKRVLAHYLVPALALTTIGTLALFATVLAMSKPTTALYIAILSFPLFFPPTLVWVAGFHFVRPGARATDARPVQLRDALLSAALVPLGFLVWAVADVLLDGGGSAFSWAAVKGDFATQFSGFLPGAIPLGFATPFVCRRFR